jgi:hypothetical protein
MIFLFRHGMVTNFERAIRNGDLKTVTNILNKDTTKSMQPWLGKYPIHVAATYGQVNVMKKLLNAGAIPSATNTQGKTALILAAEKGHVSIVRLLLSQIQTTDQINSLARDLLDFKSLPYPTYSRFLTPRVIDVLAKSGVFKVPGLLDHILWLDRRYFGTRTKSLCRIYNNNSVKLTNAMHPFHILVALIEDDCHIDRLDSTKKITRTVDHLIKKGFDINSKIMHQIDPAGCSTSPMDIVQRYTGTETHSSLNKTTILRMQTLYHILSSRGAKSSTPKPKKRNKQRKKITSWTGYTYRNIQNLRRRQPKPVYGAVYPYTKNHIEAKVLKAVDTNRHMAQVFRNTAIRAPVVPLKYSHTKFLYRGVHEWQAEQLLQSGKLDIRGYIAFSRSKRKAFEFAEKGNIGVLMRLRVEDVPKGTPWIWFDHSSNNSNNKSNSNSNSNSNNNNRANKVDRQLEYSKHLQTKNLYQSLLSSEEEVLLPPGELVLRKKFETTNNGSGVQFYEIEYTPNKTSKSLEGKPLYRRRSSQASEQNENAALAWYMSMFDIQNRKRKRNGQSPARLLANKVSRRSV